MYNVVIIVSIRNRTIEKELRCNLSLFLRKMPDEVF